MISFIGMLAAMVSMALAMCSLALAVVVYRRTWGSATSRRHLLLVCRPLLLLPEVA